jgi:hypothetical protein
MSIWDKVSKGIDRAAQVTESAIDEGKVRLAAYKARQRADKRAETLGYAVARAKAEGREPDADAMGRLVDAVHAADAEASALEARLKSSGGGTQPPPDEASSEPSPTTEGAGQ